MNTNSICDVCKQDSRGDYGVIIKDRGYVQGHECCVRALQDTSHLAYMRFLWHGERGSYTKGWLADVKRRKVVNGGEVVRDYGRKYFT